MKIRQIEKDVSVSTNPKSVLKIDEIVINWHILEPCNYSCKYCYAKFKSGDSLLYKSLKDSVRLLENISEFFSPDNLLNPLRKTMAWNSVRLSIAGGEPTLIGDRLTVIGSTAKGLGLNLSLITNGSKLDTLSRVCPSLDMLGISIDSDNVGINQAIGRTSKSGKPTKDDYRSIVQHLRKINPIMKIKVNTVVNQANVGDDMTDLINDIRPDRWKIMKMLPVTTNNLEVTDEGYQNYLYRHRAFDKIISSEDNDEMSQTYLMIDPYGRFFQNGKGKGYVYSKIIGEVGIESAFDEISFHQHGFAARYGN